MFLTIQPVIDTAIHAANTVASSATSSISAIWTIFAFGTIWFWLLVLVSSAFIISSTEDDDNNYPSSIFFIATCMILYACGNSNSFKAAGTFILENPIKGLAIIIGYILLGTVWSIFKWFFYLHRIKAEFLYNVKTYTNLYNDEKIDLSKYQAIEHKERIIHWMLYWPLSGLWTLVNDPLRHAFDWIIVHCGGMFNKITESVFSDLPQKEQTKK